VEEDRQNWPIIMGITAGIVGGIVAALYLYSVTNIHGRAETKLLDAKDIIARCHENIKQIEDTLETLRRPAVV